MNTLFIMKSYSTRNKRRLTVRQQLLRESAALILITLGTLACLAGIYFNLNS